MTVGSLFSGIGGLELGLERAGMKTLWQCEIDPYCRKVLKKHWPDCDLYEDIKELDGKELKEVDLICGGFPCQPVSVAGRQKAQSDPRWLWPEFKRIIAEVRPKYVLLENVPGLLHRGLGDILIDLASLGYDAEWDCVSAAALGAPHLRERFFLVAYFNSASRAEQGCECEEVGRGEIFTRDGKDWAMAYTNSERWSQRSRNGWKTGWAEPTDSSSVADSDSAGLEEHQRGGSAEEELTHTECCGSVVNTECSRLEGSTGQGSTGEGIAQSIFTRGSQADRRQWVVEPNVGRVAHGVPSRVDRVRTLGNAVVPQVAQHIGKLILEFEERNVQKTD